MSMETLNVIQFIELLIGFLGFTVGLPTLVFYKKVKHFQASVRFLIYFVIPSCSALQQLLYNIISDLVCQEVF